MSTVSFKNVTVQIEPALLEKIDSRAEGMDLNRSQYLRRLIRRDLGIVQPEVPANPQIDLPLPVMKGKGEAVAA